MAWAGVGSFEYYNGRVGTAWSSHAYKMITKPSEKSRNLVVGSARERARSGVCSLHGQSLAIMHTVHVIPGFVCLGCVSLD
jgi:hypothetical protein